MPSKPTKLSAAGKENLALALILLKDFKADGKFDPEISIAVANMADFLDINKEYSDLLSKIPPMKITPRHPIE